MQLRLDTTAVDARHGRPVNKLGPALADILAERNISQSELARRLDVTASAVNLWTRGRATPSRDNIIRIEDELAVEPRGSLLMLAGYAPDDHDSATVESLLRADPGIDPEDKRVILRIIRNARARYTQVEAEPARVLNLDDPDEVELWSKTTFSEDERWQLIVARRRLLAGSGPSGAEVDRGA
jgi:transcriptional regulator with XRE-family HTH domain